MSTDVGCPGLFVFSKETRRQGLRQIQRGRRWNSEC